MGDAFAQIFGQIFSITVKKLSNTKLVASRHIKRENTSLPLDERGSKTLKLLIYKRLFVRFAGWSLWEEGNY